MATQVPPKKNSAFSFECSLVSQADTDIFKTSPTLAAGDVTVSKDGGAFANIGTLPTEISDGVLTVALTAAEMNADRIAVLFNDAAGDEWQDLLVTIHTVTTSQIDDLATASAVSGLNDLAAADVWTYSTRTLTMSAAQIAAAVSGTTVNIKRGDTLSAAITGLGTITGYTTLDFTVKVSDIDADADAILRIRKNQSGSNDGLITINGADAADSTEGSITIDDAAAGDITIALKATSTDDLAVADGMYYDIQKIASGTVTTMGVGTCNVSADITRAVT